MNPTNIYLFKVNNRHIKKSCEICSNLTKKTPERRSGVFIVNFEPTSHIFLVFLLLTSNRYMLLRLSEVYLGPCQISMTELFPEYLTIFAKGSILSVRQGTKYASGFHNIFYGIAWYKKNVGLEFVIKRLGTNQLIFIFMESLRDLTLF